MSSFPQAVLAAIGSLLPRRRRAEAGRWIRPWRDDSLRLYPTSGLTPARVVAYAQAADAGAPQMLFELFDEMLAKWPRLAAVEATRRLALTGLDWGIESADRRVADYCRGVLGRIERLRDALEHLAGAIGRGVAVCELVWDAGELIDIVPVPHSRLSADAHEPWRIRIRTEEQPVAGVAIDEQPFKWVVHRARVSPGRPFSGGLLRASLPLFVAQHVSFRHWLTYTEIAGMPIRYAQYDPLMPESDRQDVLRMLEKLGTDASAAFSREIDVKLLEDRGAGAKPYEPLQDYCNTEVTILWLGQHLTTDIRASGSRAAAEVHDRVREDLLVSDIQAESETIRRGVLAPMVTARFGDGVETPRFRRSLVESVDTKALAETLAVASRELGIRIPAEWAHRALGIPQPVDGEAIVRAAPRPPRAKATPPERRVPHA